MRLAAVGILLVAMLAGVVSYRTARHAAPCLPLDVPAPGFLGGVNPPGLGPLGTGNKVTLRQAEASVPFPIYRPQTDIASDVSITDVWLEVIGGNPDKSRVAIGYGSEFEEILTPAFFTGGESPWRFFHGMANEMSLPSTSVQYIDGHPALVIPENAPEQAPAQNAASVTFAIGDFEVEMLGRCISTDDMVSAAESAIKMPE